MCSFSCILSRHRFGYPMERSRRNVRCCGIGTRWNTIFGLRYVITEYFHAFASNRLEQCRLLRKASLHTYRWTLFEGKPSSDMPEYRMLESNQNWVNWYVPDVIVRPQDSYMHKKMIIEPIAIAIQHIVSSFAIKYLFNTQIQYIFM